MTDNPDARELAREAKALVALAFRNGPIEDVHAGEPCPACRDKSGVSRISDDQMKLIMKNAVNKVYALLRLKGRVKGGTAVHLDPLRAEGALLASQVGEMVKCFGFVSCETRVCG